MPDKKKFVDELARVCEPGGTIVVVTWCHRALKEGEALEPAEKALLDRICDATIFQRGAQWTIRPLGSRRG